MQEVSEKYNNDSYRERHALSVERLRTLPFEESVEDSYYRVFQIGCPVFCLKWKLQYQTGFYGLTLDFPYCMYSVE